MCRMSKRAGVWPARLLLPATRRMDSIMPTSTKELVIKMIERMPDDATVPDIMAELYIRQKIDVGLQQLDEGQSLSQEEVEQRLSRWLS
jgi:hypothetical protein